MFEKLLDTNFTSVSVRRGTEKQMSVPARTCLFQNYAGVSNLLGCFKIMRVFQTCEGVSNLLGCFKLVMVFQILGCFK